METLRGASKVRAWRLPKSVEIFMGVRPRVSSIVGRRPTNVATTWDLRRGRGTLFVMKKPPKGPSLIPTTDSRAELPPQQRPDVRRTVGKIDREDSITIDGPSPVKKGSRLVPSGAVGLRAARHTG